MHCILRTQKALEAQKNSVRNLANAEYKNMQVKAMHYA